MSLTHSLTHSDNLAKDSKGKFKFQATAWMLTYKTHIHKKDFEIWIKTIVKRDFEFFRMAHETGLEDEEHPYEHTHVVCKVTKRFVTENCRFFDWVTPSLNETIHPHWDEIKCTKGSTHFENACSYLGKEDPENADLIKNKCFAEMVWACKSIHEALRLCHKPTAVPGMIALYNNKPRKNFEMEWKPRIFQQNILNICNKQADHRSIWWFYEKTGKVGKTWMAKYCMKTWPEKYYLINNTGSYRDFATIIGNAFATGWDGSVLMINLPRKVEENEGFYMSMEAAVDGLVTSTKYSGQTHIWDTSIVIVFANWAPKTHHKDPVTGDIGKELLSLDRWKIHEITKDEQELYIEPVIEEYFEYSLFDKLFDEDFGVIRFDDEPADYSTGVV